MKIDACIALPQLDDFHGVFFFSYRLPVLPCLQNLWVKAPNLIKEVELFDPADSYPNQQKNCGLHNTQQLTSEPDGNISVHILLRTFLG